MKWTVAIFLFVTSGFGLTTDTAAQPAELEDALWKGVLTLHVKGPMFRQYLTDRLVDDRIPVGFIKEKGNMDLDIHYRLTFLINSLGEYTLLAEETITGEQKINWEYRHRFQEEKKVKEAGINIKVHQDVYSVKTVKTLISFDRKTQYNRTQFSFGSLELTPSGRMNKKGALDIKGTLNVTVTGTGTVITTEERQPASEDFKNRRITETVEKNYNMPITFSAAVKHRKKSLQGTLDVKAPVSDPFPQVETDERIAKNFNHRIQVSGSYTLEPLFGKK